MDAPLRLLCMASVAFEVSGVVLMISGSTVSGRPDCGTDLEIRYIVRSLSFGQGLVYL